MKIEFLYPQICNLFGESGHVRFLRRLFSDATFFETRLQDEPTFARQEMDLIYMGGMTENNQEKVLAALLPLRPRLAELIEGGTHFLFTGNALELVGRYIEEDSGRRIAALDFFPFYAKRQMDKRLHDYYLGELVLSGPFAGAPEQALTGFKTQFSQAYPLDELPWFCRTRKGFGLNQGVAGEGLAYKGFLATYLVGPLLILNPHFTRLWLKTLGEETRELPFEEALQDAYNMRLSHFQNPKTKIS